jgi:hypothetical protein
VPLWAKLIVIFAAILLAALSLSRAWSEASSVVCRLPLGPADAEMMKRVAALSSKDGAVRDVVLAHALNVIVTIKKISNHQSLALLAVATGFSLMAVGFALFLIGADGAFRIQASKQTDAKLMLTGTAPGLLCFILAAALVAVGATRHDDTELANFTANPAGQGIPSSNAFLPRSATTPAPADDMTPPIHTRRKTQNILYGNVTYDGGDRR